MQTTISVSQELIQQAMESTGEDTPQGVVEKALHLLIGSQANGGMRELFGKFAWKGNLDEMRSSRSFDHLDADAPQA